MIKTKVAFLETRLLSSLSEQFKKYSKSSDWLKKAGPPKKPLLFWSCKQAIINTTQRGMRRSFDTSRTCIATEWLRKEGPWGLTEWLRRKGTVRSDKMAATERDREVFKSSSHPVWCHHNKHIFTVAYSSDCTIKNYIISKKKSNKLTIMGKHKTTMQKFAVQYWKVTNR